MHQLQTATNNTQEDWVLLALGKVHTIASHSKRENKLIKVSKHHSMHQPQKTTTNNTKEDQVLLTLGNVQKRKFVYQSLKTSFNASTKTS